MVTVYDVAKRAGVKHTTVSHALSGKRPVAEATRKRIMAAIEELGYRPHAAAQNLASGRSGLIGLAAPLDLATRHADYAHASLIAKISTRLNDHGYKLLCLISRSVDADEVLDLVHSNRVDGMLLLEVRCTDPRVVALRSDGIPFVSIGRSQDAEGVVEVDLDFAQAAVLAVRYLWELGHRHIAFLTATQEGELIYGYQRHALEGFHRAHTELDLALDPRHLLHYEDEQECRLRIERLRTEHPEVSALITMMDVEAATALQIVTAQGLRVPADLSLISLTDSPMTLLASPPITTVTYTRSETDVAVDLLVEMLAGTAPESLEHLMSAVLLPRETSGPFRERVAGAPGVPTDRDVEGG